MQWIGQTTRRVTFVSLGTLALIALLGLVPWTLVGAETGSVETGRPEQSLPPSKEAGQVQIEARFIDAPAGTLRKMLAAVVPVNEPAELLPSPKTMELLDKALTTALLNKLQKAKDVEMLASPTIVANFGQAASIQIGNFIPGSEADTDANFEGLSLEVVTESRDENLTLKIDARRRTRIPDPELPAFRETRIETRLLMPPGHTAVLGSMIDEKSNEMLVLISARLLPRTADAASVDRAPSRP